ncbi:MAG TPA: hypothetical protein VET89_06975 [Stellaceae bacterium]|nr:hypothetical protein [Stellaceae bacterium]
MKSMAGVLGILGLLVVLQPTLQTAQARDDEVGRSVAQLASEVRSLTGQMRALQDTVNRLAAHGPVALMEVPSSTTRAQAEETCHRLGGQLQTFLQDPAASKLLCRF